MGNSIVEDMKMAKTNYHCVFGGISLKTKQSRKQSRKMFEVLTITPLGLVALSQEMVFDNSFDCEIEIDTGALEEEAGWHWQELEIVAPGVCNVEVSILVEAAVGPDEWAAVVERARVQGLNWENEVAERKRAPGKNRLKKLTWASNAIADWSSAVTIETEVSQSDSLEQWCDVFLETDLIA